MSIPVPSPILKTYTRELSCTLTEDEWNDRAKALAAAVQEIAREEDRHTTLKSQMKSSLQALEAKRNRLASVVASSTEYREVTVELIASFPTNAAIEIRTDTGEEISRRFLVDSERQQALPIDPGPDDLDQVEATS